MLAVPVIGATASFSVEARAELMMNIMDARPGPLDSISPNSRNIAAFQKDHKPAILQQVTDARGPDEEIREISATEVVARYGFFGSVGGHMPWAHVGFSIGDRVRRMCGFL